MNENTLKHVSWTIIEQLFKENEQCLVSHHIDSYNSFVHNGIPRIFKENNPCRYLENAETNQTECLIYLGGKNGTAIHYGKPVIYDENTNHKHYMYPNDARLRNMTYGISIHYDVDIDFIYYTDTGEKTVVSKSIPNVFLGKFPIMVQSNLCILKGLAPDARFNMGECRNDYGGYFIIDGKEKLIISQEKFADNMLYIREYPEGSENYCSAEIRSVSEDTSKPIRVNSVAMVAPTARLTNGQIVVNVPNVRKPVPLFVLMRALGIESDKQIIEYCLLDLEQNKKYIDLFIPSIHHASVVFNQHTALEFIALFTKRQRVITAQEVLMNYFLAHLGTTNFIDKAYFVGYMVRKMLRVYMKDDHPTDRDNFKCKRIELTGPLMYDLFREYYLTQKRKIELEVDRLHFNTSKYKGSLIVETFVNIQDIFKKNGMIVQDGVKKALKGNWGSMQYTKRVGLVQDVARLSWFAFMSHLRKVNLNMDPTAKVVKPHLLNNSQFGYIDPVDTPDGGNIGLHKHIAISTVITTEYSGDELIKWLLERFKFIIPLASVHPRFANENTKLFVNGKWIGLIEYPLQMVKILKLYKRNGVIPFHTSIRFNYRDNELTIYTDSGRMTRPIYYIEGGEPSFVRAIPEKVSSRKHKPSDLQELSTLINWSQLVAGFSKKNVEGFNPMHNQLYSNSLLGLDVEGDDALISQLNAGASVIEYIDVMEEESALIAFKLGDITKYHTHLEIDPSLMLGVLGNSIIFPEHNQLPRDLFSCGQSKQAVSVYHTNYQMRLDKMSVVLQYGQVPLIKSRYLELMTKEEHPYGVNTIVAIMCYSGYNVEDAILINQGAVDRGLFRTTYYSTYEASEDIEVSNNITSKTSFFDFKTGNVRTSPGSDYSYLDHNGVVVENTEVNDKVVMIGAIKTSSDSPDVENASVFTKKGQLGYVDKTFITESDNGLRLAKIRVREERIPAIGDKMASRAGQKGTIGLLIPEKDMPYTEDGIRPDIIINPHALPSRMTIGQLVETIFGKVCLHNGSYGDCTAFATNGPNHELYGKLMQDAGFHSSGNQLLYNGMNGEQIESNIFIGPTYYMRLKHMVKDKINYRSNDGPNTMLTRQPVQGRANDGGLRIGEMERDSVMSHGMTHFLTESFLKRADEYYMAVCNKTGMIAVYNEEMDLFYSPSADGPGSFGETDGKPIRQISRFGRSFSVIRVPFSFKQLIQELQVINVQMRIITDDNVDRLLYMSKSDNVNKLLNYPATEADDFKYLLDASYLHQSAQVSLQTKMDELKNQTPVEPVQGPPAEPVKPMEVLPEEPYVMPVFEKITNQTGWNDVNAMELNKFEPVVNSHQAIYNPESKSYVEPWEFGYKEVYVSHISPDLLEVYSGLNEKMQEYLMQRHTIYELKNVLTQIKQKQTVEKSKLEKMTSEEREKYLQAKEENRKQRRQMISTAADTFDTLYNKIYDKKSNSEMIPPEDFNVLPKERKIALFRELEESKLAIQSLSSNEYETFLKLAAESKLAETIITTQVVQADEEELIKGGDVPEGWKKHFSKKANRDYYFNAQTGGTVWNVSEIPHAKEDILKGGSNDDDDDNEDEDKIEKKPDETRKMKIEV
jgi:DNA-directed RNA polymerase II subunit RPB2